MGAVGVASIGHQLRAKLSLSVHVDAGHVDAGHVDTGHSDAGHVDGGCVAFQ